MTTQQDIPIGLTVLGLAVGTDQTLEPRTPDKLRQQQEQRVEGLGEAVERQNGKLRDDATDHVDSRHDRRLRPAATERGPEVGLRPMS